MEESSYFLEENNNSHRYLYQIDLKKDETDINQIIKEVEDHIFNTEDSIFNNEKFDQSILEKKFYNYSKFN